MKMLEQSGFCMKRPILDTRVETRSFPYGTLIFANHGVERLDIFFTSLNRGLLPME
jgi:hypothetical protein